MTMRPCGRGSIWRIAKNSDVLKVDDVAMAFDKPLFDSVSFEVKKGERVALLGPNGVGKTTMFHLIQKRLEIQLLTLAMCWYSQVARQMQQRWLPLHL